MKKLGMALAAVMVMSSFAQAEPGPAVEKLMNEPVSAFHYGMDKTQQYLRHKFRDTYPDSWIYYDWDQNRIVAFLQKKVPSYTYRDFMLACEVAISELRKWGDVKDGRLSNNFQSSPFVNGFYPTNWRVKATEGTSEELLNIIQLRFIIVDEQDNRKECSAPLLGTGYAIEKN